MSSVPCQICGSTDLNLVDGFYYCVECGTQDANVRETVVEHTMLADGTFAQVLTKKKFSTVLKDSVQMSAEWHKWHAYNFILAGLTDELIALGAKPSVRPVILWIWVRYIKSFQKKDDMETTQFDKMSVNEEDTTKEAADESISGSDASEMDNENVKNVRRKKTTKKKYVKYAKFQWDIEILTKGTLLTILYLALNFDRSEIQITHLFRFIREGRLSLYNCVKFVPKELDVKSIPYWINFVRCQIEYTPIVIRSHAMTVLKRLKLGPPLVPDLNNIIDNYIRELCLPEDFKNLILSLIDILPLDFLKLNTKRMKTLVRTPDYEGICMTYILVGLKMCFGLDCDYEIKLSDCIDRINTEQNYLKYYKLGKYSEATDRLFSFREWCTFLQFRKMILCKYYLPMSRQYNLPTDDCVFMEHLEERKRREVKLGDDVTMDILKKIPIDHIEVIPKKEFPPTLTPMSLYTEIITEHIKDPDLKLRLCEDFSQYALKYATQKLELSKDLNYDKNLIQGVNDTNKIINLNIIGTLGSEGAGDPTMVLVRNCENKNWLKTKPPKANHVTKINENGDLDDRESDIGYESCKEITIQDSNETANGIAEEDLVKNNKHQIIEEEYENISIFDDDFIDLQILEDDKKDATHWNDSITPMECPSETSHNLYDSKIDIDDSFSESLSNTNNFNSTHNYFNPNNFDKDKIIQELIEIACKKYKITIPKENVPLASVPKKKRKNSLVNKESTQNDAKRKKTNCEHKKLDDLVKAYYDNLKSDVLTKVSDNVRSAIEIAENREDYNNTSIVDNASHIGFEERDLQNQKDASHSCTNNPVLPINTVQNDTLNDTDEEESDEESILPKNDPKFDDKTHDINQLYIKLREDNIIDSINNIEPDLDVMEIIDHEIDAFNKGHKNVSETFNAGNKRGKGRTTSISDVSEDNVSLSKESLEKTPHAKKKDKNKLKRKLKNVHIEQFGYWMRHYKSKAFVKYLHMTQKFNLELIENCPISFVFVLRECGTIANCTPYNLYKHLKKLEVRLARCTY